MQARLCECRYFPGGLLGGQGEYRWDCGVRRPSCLAPPPRAGEVKDVRDFVRTVLAEEGVGSASPARPAPPVSVEPGFFARLIDALSDVALFPGDAEAEPRVLRKAPHALDQVAATLAARPEPKAEAPSAWRMAKAPVASLGDRFSQLEAAREDERRRLEQRIARLEARLADERGRTAELRSRVEASDRRFASLTGRLEEMRAGHQSVLDRMTGRAYLTVGALEEAIAMTGLDPRSLLLGGDKLETALGGPFIPADPPEGPEPVVAMENAIALLDTQMSRWEQLHDLLGRLPLSAPLDHFTVTSDFGPRKDPVNGKKALHKGIDLKAPPGTPVMATAPGRVVFAGWRGRFGRTVEIDHGYGLVTRYAHLRKILVKRGEPVGHRQTIGLLGSSGRSTGPHVHYEIMAESGQLDPEGFFEAGLHLFKGPGSDDDRTAEVAAE